MKSSFFRYMSKLIRIKQSETDIAHDCVCVSTARREIVNILLLLLFRERRKGCNFGDA